MGLTLGSLFDGAGTIPFAAELCGITPIWSSEIEKFPRAVTAKRFPNMKQLGDITKINGREIEPVDIIAGGSPCQSLSLAGKREGLKGVSGLFMEQIRVIKEMRDATSKRADEPIRPRYAVWENVPGAFSSNKGEDFRVVLEEFCRVKDENAHIPKPAHGGGVDFFGSYLGRRVFRGLARPRCSILGSAPTSSKNLACGRFWRRTCRRGSCFPKRLVSEFYGDQKIVASSFLLYSIWH